MSLSGLRRQVFEIEQSTKAFLNIPLVDACSQSNLGIPLPLHYAFSFLELPEWRLTPNIYSSSPDSSVDWYLREAASFVIQYLSSLPEPVTTYSLFACFVRAGEMSL